MAYSVDASAIIDAWRKWYSPPHHPSLWDRIETLASEGVFRMPDLVFEEIEEKDDEVYTWCKEREGVLKVDSGVEVQKNVSKVVNKYKNLAQGDGKKNGADPFVVAHAMNNGSVVLTHEEPTGDLNGPRIPDVCSAENVEWIRFPGLFEKEGWRF